MCFCKTAYYAVTGLTHESQQFTLRTFACLKIEVTIFEIDPLKSLHFVSLVSSICFNIWIYYRLPYLGNYYNDISKEVSLIFVFYSNHRCWENMLNSGLFRKGQSESNSWYGYISFYSSKHINVVEALEWIRNVTHKMHL